MILLTFDSCNSGTIEYDIPSINRQGIVSIQRVANDNIVIREALNADLNQFYYSFLLGRIRLQSFKLLKFTSGERLSKKWWQHCGLEMTVTSITTLECG